METRTAMTDLLESLSQAHGLLQNLRPLPPEVVEELGYRVDVALTHHSTAIEGNTLTQSETEIVLEKGITVSGKSLIEHLEVVGHKEALDFIKELAGDQQPIGEWEIRQIHSLVMKGQESPDKGGYRSLDVQAAGTGHRYPSHLKVPELMAEFISWLSESSDDHPVIGASEAHLRFVCIHPFRDGNGRVGRLLLNLLLLRAGYPIAVIPVTRRVEYISSLEEAQREGSRTSLDHLVMEAVRQGFCEIFQTAASSSRLSPEGKAQIQEWLDPHAQTG